MKACEARALQAGRDDKKGVWSRDLYNKYIMTQDEKWLSRYNEVRDYIEQNHRNPSKHRVEEHDMLNWLKANRKALNAGKMKPERVEKSTIVDFRHDSTKFE